MNRKILFRGKQKGNGKWVFGGYYQNELETYIVQDGFVCTPVDPKTVGQDTGLQDKNGKEIFEHDILIGAWGTKLILYYDECYLGFKVREFESDIRNEIDYYGLNRIEIVGNIGK